MATKQPALEDDDTFAALSESEKEALANALVSDLGETFKATTKRAGQLSYLVLRHRPTKLDMVVIPGGFCELGYGTRDRNIVNIWLGPDNPRPELKRFIDDRIPSFKPPRMMRIEPFLAGYELVSPKALSSLLQRRRELAYVSADEAVSAAKAAGCRLLSEEEWEYLARDGGGETFVGRADDTWYLDAAWQADTPLRGLSALGLPEWTQGEDEVVRRGFWYGRAHFEDAVPNALAVLREPAAETTRPHSFRLARSL